MRHILRMPSLQENGPGGEASMNNIHPSAVSVRLLCPATPHSLLTHRAAAERASSPSAPNRIDAESDMDPDDQDH